MQSKDVNYIGAYAEQLFSAECLKRQINVCRPLIDSSIYDCIVDVRNELFKIQIKSTTKTPIEGDPNIHIPIMNGNKKEYTKDCVDYFAIYVEYYNGFFIFPNKGDMSAVRLSLDGKYQYYFNNYQFKENQLEICFET